MPSFDNKKELRFVISLLTGTFGSSNANQITLEGLRASVTIENGGGNMSGVLSAQIWGVSPSDMASITTLRWKISDMIVSQIEVYAIDGDRQTCVFIGNIQNAWPDYSAMPDVSLTISAQIGIAAQLTPIPPTSYKGSVEVKTAMGKLAATMGFDFEPNNVAISMTDVYLPNTGLAQARSLAKAAGIDLYLDRDVLAITPRNSPRGTLVPEVSRQSGLSRAPMFDLQGVHFDTLFNPAILFGGLFNLVTDVPQASGLWIAYSITHHLESEKPGGAWFSTVRGCLRNVVAI